MTLILWKAPVVREAEEAKALLQHWYDSGDESALEPSPDIARFLAADLFVMGGMVAAILGFVDVNEGRKPCVEDKPPL